MKDLQKIIIGVTFLVSAVQALCYASSALWIWVILICVTGFIWIFGQVRRWRWSGHAGLISFTAISARGIFTGINPLWFLLSVTLALVAWDMNMFLVRTGLAERVEKKAYLEKQHCKKLAAAAGIGLIVGVLSLNLDFSLAFGWLLLLGMFIVICMSRLIRMLTGPKIT